MLDNVPIQRYLRATPFGCDDGIDFDGNIGEDFFFNELYYDTEKAKNKKSKILGNMKDNADAVIILKGYSGCGKTTFIHYLLREKKRVKLIFNMESGINNQLEDPILSKIISELEDVLVDDIIDNCRILENVYDIFFKSDFKLNGVIKKYLDSEYKIKKFLDDLFREEKFREILQKIYQDKNERAKIDLKEIVHIYLNEMEALQIFGFYILLDLAEEIGGRANGSKNDIGCVFCFDNLDNIDNIEKTKRFVKYFTQAWINIKTMLRECNFEKFSISRNAVISGYTAILAVRETTYARITEHYNETVKAVICEEIVSELYVKSKIVKKRTDFLKKNRRDIPAKLYSKAETISSIFDNKYLDENLFAMFNNSYNTAIKTISKICDENEELITEYSNLIKFKNRKINRGANGIILRLFFDFFKEAGFYENGLDLYDLNQKESQYKFSPARLILTYLYNTNSEVCLYDLFNYFEDVILDEDIAQIIDKIYLLRFSSWRHLLTFNTYPPMDESGLQNQIDLYREGKPIKETREKYSKIELTCAGRVYLNTMCTNFEFFASRLFGNKRKPLFSKFNLKKSNGRYEFDIIISKVYSVVKECCQRLLIAENEIMKTKDWRLDQYYCSKFIYEKKSEYKVRQFHAERIIFSHIGYINIFRQYLLKKQEFSYDIKLEINKILVEHIRNYLNLYLSNKCLKSQTNKEVAKELDEQIKIIENNKYTNFDVLIETNNFIKKFI